MSESKQHILAIALRLFLQKNFKEVTMKEIVERTGLSKGAFYHYFESKEELFREVIDEFYRIVVDIDFSVLPGDTLNGFYNACAERIGGMKLPGSDRHHDNPSGYFDMNFFFLVFDGLQMFPDFRKKMEAYNAKELRAWTGVVAHARAQGEISSPMSDRQIAQIFIHTSDGIAMNLILSGNTANLKDELTSMWDNFYKSLQ